MTIQEILDRVSEYHPDLGEDYHGCDEVKFGDCSQECTGIVSALVPTVDVIRRAVELKANLLYVHEPVSYLTPDWPEWKADYKCRIYDEKLKLLKENKIVLVRDHDHMHAHKPDSIFTGVLKYLGWMEYSDSIADYDYYVRTFGNLDCLKDSEKDPMYCVKKAVLQKNMPEVYQAVGTEDFLIEENRMMKKYLEKEGVKVTYHEAEGIHDWSFWNKYLPEAVEWLLK